MDWLVTLAETYAALERMSGTMVTEQRNLLEPFEHVAAVERLRQDYRPAGEVRLLLMAESHVRVSAAAFQRRGAGFLYESWYHTPWWETLILPGCGGTHLRSSIRRDPQLRRRALGRLRDAGFWVLDLSILALSGYQKRGIEAAASRPFGAHTRGIVGESWAGHVAAQFEGVMAQARQPIVAAFALAVGQLPGCAGARIASEAARPYLKFFGMSNRARYGDAGYAGGTATFAALASEAGLATCLSDVQ